MKVLVVAVLGLAACGGAAGMGGTDGGAEGPAGPRDLPSTLTPADVARRLSLFLWEQAPDAELLEKVYTPPVTTKAAVKSLAVEMLADPRARVGVRRFFHQWLRLDGLATAKKDPAT